MLTKHPLSASRVADRPRGDRRFANAVCACRPGWTMCEPATAPSGAPPVKRLRRDADVPPPQLTGGIQHSAERSVEWSAKRSRGRSNQVAGKRPPSSAGGGHSGMLPSRRRMTRSYLSGTPASCVATIVVVPARSRNSSKKSTISAPVVESRLALGSSASSKTGSFTSARGIALRCCCPPDSLEGSESYDPQAPRTNRSLIAARHPVKLEADPDQARLLRRPAAVPLATARSRAPIRRPSALVAAGGCGRRPTPPGTRARGSAPRLRT
jgi:hypothetical protein